MLLSFVCVSVYWMIYRLGSYFCYDQYDKV